MSDDTPDPRPGEGKQDRQVRPQDPVIIPEPRLAVVIPTQNNELSIGSLVLLARQHTSYVIVVDDGSRDNTVTIAEHAGAVVLNAGAYGGGRVYSILAGC